MEPFTPLLEELSTPELAIALTANPDPLIKLELLGPPSGQCLLISLDEVNDVQKKGKARAKALREADLINTHVSIPQEALTAWTGWPHSRTLAPVLYHR